MSYVKNSPLKKKRVMSNFRLSENQKKRLKKHGEIHKKNGNCCCKVRKHVKVMRDLMRQGNSFKKSHIEAQKKYPMV